MHKRPKVLVFCDWFVPGYKAGGPIRSVYNIVEGLKNEVDFWVVTRDTDLGESESYHDIQSDVWTDGAGYHVCYLSKQRQRLKRFLAIIREKNWDVVYLNSLFSPKFALEPLLLNWLIKNKARVILAPRGMLGTGALNIKSRKKAFFLSLTKAIGFYRGVLWHASTPVEKKQIEEMFGNEVQISVARNMPVPLPDEIGTLKKHKDELRLIFLARVSIVKNLHLALDYLLESAGLVGESEIYFDIYGPLEEPSYWEECQRIIDKMPSNIHVSHHGELTYPEVSSTLKQYHFLYLPTSTENYGHAIVECLVHGIPVIISDQTPWKSLSEYKAGWDIPVTEEQKYIEVLNSCCKMDAEEYIKWAIGARAYAERFIVTDEVKNENLSLFVGEENDFRS